jgi:hypothetical protein
MAEPTWLPNTGSQLDRALRAYFVAAGVVTADQCYISNDYRVRKAPLLDITVGARDAVPSELFSGNFNYPVDLTFEWPAKPPAGHNNPEAYQIGFDKFMGAVTWLMYLNDVEHGLPTVCDAITAAGRALKTAGSAKDQANNVDMDKFTVLFIEPTRERRLRVSDDSDGAVYWSEQRGYNIVACSNDVS